MSNPITRHLKDVGESYPEHFIAASGFGIRMMTTGLACFIHSIFPFLFEKTGSDMVRRLHDEMVIKRRKADNHDWVI